MKVTTISCFHKWLLCVLHSFELLHTTEDSTVVQKYAMEGSFDTRSLLCIYRRLGKVLLPPRHSPIHSFVHKYLSLSRKPLISFKLLPCSNFTHSQAHTLHKPVNTTTLVHKTQQAHVPHDSKYGYQLHNNTLTSIAFCWNHLFF